MVDALLKVALFLGRQYKIHLHFIMLVAFIMNIQIYRYVLKLWGFSYSVVT
jgi:hypothetical protein